VNGPSARAAPAPASAIDTREMDGMTNGMTTTKIAVSLPEELVARARLAVRRGRASSVSAYVASALESKVTLDELALMLDQMLEETGGPLTATERRAADQALGMGGRRRKRAR
jgi:Arc/MetJ-type ribon-helix-helix transcriptional regulator